MELPRFCVLTQGCVAPTAEGWSITGTWQGFRSGLLFVTQTQSCVAIEGLSNHSRRTPRNRVAQRVRW